MLWKIRLKKTRFAVCLLCLTMLQNRPLSAEKTTLKDSDENIHIKNKQQSHHFA